MYKQSIMKGMGGLNNKNIKQYLDLDTQFLTNSVITQLTLNPIDFYIFIAS